MKRRRCYHAHKSLKTPLERIAEQAAAAQRYMEHAVIQLLNLTTDETTDELAN